MVLTTAATAQVVDPLATRERTRIPVSVKIEIPSSLDTLRFGFGIGGAGALLEPTHDGLDLVVRSAVHPASAAPGPMDQLGRLLDRSPVNIGDAGPSDAGLQFELFSPGDIGASVKYRW